MEVHHHPEVEKKGFKEYLLEGLMIFIAVMMGFFAESLREHIADNNKEREYMRSMVEDLKADTAELSSCIRQFGTISSKLDTMLTCLKTDTPDPVVINRIVSNHFFLYTEYSYNNRTVQQLKNSGVFRLVRNNNVAASILKYDNFQNTIMLTQYADLKNTMYAYKDVEARVMHYKDLDIAKGKSKAFKDFDPADFVANVKQPFVTPDKDGINYYYNKLFIHDSLCHDYTEFNNWLNKNMLSGSKAGDLAKQSFYNMPLKVRDPVQLNRLANSAVNYKGWIAGYIPILYEAKKQAADLLKLINEEYGAEE